LLIREVKRFVAENASIKPSQKPLNGKQVAIVGAGPSGLSCAYYLAQAGFKVDVYESESQAGGMVRYAIPGFRLTNEALERDISRILQLGVTIEYNHRVTSEEFSLLKNTYDFLYISAGAQKATPLNIDGIEAAGVYDSLAFLKDVKAGKIKEVGKNVIVIGGGNTAMDAARTAHRLVGTNGKVTIVYRRTVDEMPADEGEIKAVITEGTEIIELATPERLITEKGNVCGLVCSRMVLEGSDEKGRRKPVKVDNSEFTLPCDTVIPAIGQEVDIDFVPEEFLRADTTTYKTLLRNVYIGGDALRGAATAIKAIGDGRKVAEQIINQAGIQRSIKTPTDKSHSKEELILKRAKRVYAAELPEPSPSESLTFRLVSQTLDKQAIVAESARCLQCDEICNICTTVCPNLANFSYDIVPVKYNMQKVMVGEDGELKFEPDRLFEVRQRYQILNIANFCNECGNCATFCPTNSAPYLNKPKLHLSTKSFNSSDEGYMLSKLEDRNVLIYKNEGGIKTLSETAGELLYETDHVTARFDHDSFKLKEVRVKTPCVRQIQFQHAAEMSIILKGAKARIKDK